MAYQKQKNHLFFTEPPHFDELCQVTVTVPAINNPNVNRPRSLQPQIIKCRFMVCLKYSPFGVSLPLTKTCIPSQTLTHMSSVNSPSSGGSRISQRGGRQLFTVSTYERHVTSLHNQQAKTSHVIFM